jgi:RNA polymerase sigma-70 factor (sigma-E family)
VDDIAVVPGTGREAPGADAPDSGAVGFDAFVAAHGPRLLRTAYLLTGDHGAAEDLLQDTLVRAWDRWSRVSGADQPLAYVRRMLVNASVSRWRALRLRQGGERLVATPPERGTADPTGHDDEVWRLVATLPPRQRAVVVLAYYEDLADAQVAETLGCATGTVKSQRAKALRALRGRLGEER